MPTLRSLEEELEAHVRTGTLLRTRRAVTARANRNLLSSATAARRCCGGAAAAIPTADAGVTLRVALYAARDRGVRSQEFQVAGTTRLVQLADAVYCPAAAVAGIVGARSFFGIEGVCYEDTRALGGGGSGGGSGGGGGSSGWRGRTRAGASAAATAALIGMLESDDGGGGGGALEPLAAGVVAWSHRGGGGGTGGGLEDWGPMQLGDATTATFGAIPLRLGAHYVFAHEVAPPPPPGSGGVPSVCEHLLVFLDAAVGDTDTGAGAGTDVPVLLHQAPTVKARCGACGGRRYATAATVGDRLAPRGANPAYWCAPCFDAAHRAADGSLLFNDFTLLPYLHD